MLVMSVRLTTKDVKRLQAVAEQEHKERSAVVRELLREGLKYKMLLAYREGAASLSQVSRTLELSLSETIELLASFGIPSPVSYDDYLQGMATARNVIR